MKSFICSSVLLLLTFKAFAGAPAPEFSELKAVEGKPVLVDFWASWCAPCQKSFPWLNSMKEKYPDLEIIAINLDEDVGDAKKFLDGRDTLFKVAYDPDGELAEAYQVEGMPSSYLIDKNGNIVEAHVGFFANKTHEYEESLKKILD